MPFYRRLYVPGGTYFFTVNLQDRRSRLLVEHVDALRAAYRYGRSRRPFETVAICILPEHLHCIWTLPEDDHDFSTRWRLIKSAFSRALPVDVDPAPGRRAGERGIWQRRFWEHAIRDDADLAAHVDYIHANPVKHGHAADMDEWPYSSWRRYRRDVGREWTPSPETLRVGEPGT